MADVEPRAEERPGSQDRLSPRRGSIESKDANWRVVHAVKDIGASGKIIQLLGELEVARVKDGAEDPAGDAYARQPDVKRTERIIRGHSIANFTQSIPVRP